MSTFDEYKKSWQEKSADVNKDTFPTDAFYQMVRMRAKKHLGMSMRYFWASLTYNIIVYSMLAHVLIRYIDHPRIVVMVAAGLLIFIPFTVVLVLKFRKIAVVKGNDAESIQHRLQVQLDLLINFFRLKKRYEWFLIPLSCVVGVILTFEIFVPGALRENIPLGLIILMGTLVSCIAAVVQENRKNFKEPIRELKALLSEFSQ
jgi:hypothetical protein